MSKGSQVDIPDPVNPREAAEASFPYASYSQYTPLGDFIINRPGDIPAGQSDASFLGDMLIGPESGNPFRYAAGANLPSRPNTPSDTASTSLRLSPEMQAILDAQLTVTGNSLMDALQRQQLIGDMPNLITSLGDDVPPVPEANYETRQASEQALFGRGMNLLNPYLQRQEDSTRQMLASRGLNENDAAGQEALGFMSQQQQQQINDLLGRAVEAGGAEQSRLWGLENEARNADINTRLTNANLAQIGRGASLNEIAQALGQQQVAVPTQGNFFAPNPVDMMTAYGLNQSGQIGRANTQANVKGSQIGGLAEIGSAAIPGMK